MNALNSKHLEGEAMIDKTKVGEHELWFEPEFGLTHIVYRGMLNEVEVIEMEAVTAKWQKTTEPSFYLIDNRSSTGITREGRKAIAKTSGARSGEVFCAIFGAAFALRVLLNLMFKAMELTSSKTATRFTVDEAEARAWLAERKRAYLARTGS